LFGRIRRGTSPETHHWRWLALFLPQRGMFYAQRQLFPASAHIECQELNPKTIA
jgi:hypothetical protein